MNHLHTNFPIALTFDIDWAPDFAIRKCLDILDKYKVPATFFVTHESSLMQDLVRHDFVELGVHPNFLPGTTHGRTIDEVLETVIGFCPDTTLIRTHGLYQSTNFLFHILREYPQLKQDFSIYIPNNPYIIPIKFYGERSRSILRVPYHWEDDLFFYEDVKNAECLVYETANYQILNFHPIHIYLNSSDMGNYCAMKENLKCGLSNAKEHEIKRYVNDKEGMHDYLETMLESNERERFVFASHIKTTCHRNYNSISTRNTNMQR